ncbi:UNVERIFIED_CONTAM: FxsA family protein, partial [Salmonella enterica subsp. enterica serovar Weltevreden]
MGLLLFLIWIVSEGVIIAKLGEAFGASRVLLYLVLAVVAGVIVIQRHGLRAIQQVRESMNRGELPAAAMI